MRGLRWELDPDRSETGLLKYDDSIIFYVFLGQDLSLYKLPNSSIFSRMGSSFSPLSVNEYSTRGGNSGETWR